VTNNTEQTWHPDERPGEKRSERYCPNASCKQYTKNTDSGTHCPECGFYFMPGIHPSPTHRQETMMISDMADYFKENQHRAEESLRAELIKAINECQDHLKNLDGGLRLFTGITGSMSLVQTAAAIERFNAQRNSAAEDGVAVTRMLEREQQ
jgi:hypothetical protein